MDSRSSPLSSPDQSKTAAAEHIAVEASRLARIANEQELGLLAHLIDMVILEAWREATEPDGEPAVDVD